MTRPVLFTVSDVLPLPPEEIAAQILDLRRWAEFAGYGLLPGIRSAQFETLMPDVVGTRIRVVDTRGDTHIEEIVEWEPDTRIGIRMDEFPPPLSRWANWFDEVWRFERLDDGFTRVVREFALHPRSNRTRPLLRLIAVLLRASIVRQLRQMKAGKIQSG